MAPRPARAASFAVSPPCSVGLAMAVLAARLLRYKTRNYEAITHGTAVSRTLSVWTFSYITNFRARRNFPSQRYIATPTVAFRRPLPVKGAPPRAFVLNKQNVQEQSYRTIPCTTLLVVRADSTLVLRSALHGRLFEGTPG